MVATGITVVKLVLYPLTVWCLLTDILDVGLFWSSAGTLIATLPSASSNFALAQRYTDDAERISAGIVPTTLVSVVTVPLAGWLLVHS